MKYLTVLIKPASSLCNMRCKYCFYSDVSDNREITSYGIMTEEVMHILIEKMVEAIDEGGVLSVAFQGGEPTLAGINYFYEFISALENKRMEKGFEVNYSIQTNGTMLDDSWCALFKKYNFLVGLSLDGPEELHDGNRLGNDKNGTHERVMKAKGLLEKYRVDFNVLCVLTEKHATHAKEIWQFFNENDLKYIQFIPCLDDLNCSGNDTAISPEMFYEFYKEILWLWIDEIRRDNYISIKLFDDIANLLVYRDVTACGLDGRCNLQYVVEANGNVYPCDFYVLDQYCLGNLMDIGFEELKDNFHKSIFHEKRNTHPQNCNDCRWRNLCRGGCVRLRDSMYIHDDFCGYSKFLDEAYRPICAAAEYLAYK